MDLLQFHDGLFSCKVTKSVTACSSDGSDYVSRSNDPALNELRHLPYLAEILTWARDQRGQ